MPNIEVTDNPTGTFSNMPDSSFSYDYPDGLDLRPGSKLHSYVKNQILQRAREANGSIKRRFSSWNETDKVLTSFVELDDDEKDLKSKDERTPVSIVFPYSYAILETILSYLMAAFFQEPIFRYEGVSPEDTLGAIMLEKAIDIQCNKSKVMLNLHTQFRDGLAYGFGAGAPVWTKRMGLKSVIEDTGFMSVVSGLFKPTGQRRGTEETVLFEGNELVNIDPYLCLPDPSVSINEVQKGEFFGWLDRSNLMNLLSDEENSDGDYFNVKYLRSVHNKESSIFGIEQSRRDDKFGGTWRRNTTNVLTPVDVVRMYINLIPKQWKLGKSEYPEKWLFALAADDIVIQAKPLGLNHNMYPVTINAPDFDGYSSSPISRLETLSGLQGTLDWLFNAHISNVRKSVNDMFVVDPYLVNIEDVKKPGAGKIIRTRRPAWGRGTKDVIQQLGVTDITRGHIADSSWIVQWMQKIGGADDAAMGSLRQGGPERLTSNEFSGTQAGAASRLARIARIIGLQSMQDMAYMFASHTQQLMSQELYAKTTGRWQEVLSNDYANAIQNGKMKITPHDLIVEYDVKGHDGSVPGSNFSEGWIRYFEILTKDPEIRADFDIPKLFKYIARNMGAKNVEEFVKIKVKPDEEILRAQERGNAVGTEEAIAEGLI